MNDAELKNRRDSFVASAKANWLSVWEYQDWLACGAPASYDELRQTFGIVKAAVKTSTKVADDTRIKKTGVLRLPEMFRQGKIKAGDSLTIKNHAESTAVVVDGKTVRFNGVEMTYNAYGQQVIGHKAVNVYVWVQANGTLLNDLRG